MKKYIDLHAHPFQEYFTDCDQVIIDAQRAGVNRMFLVGTDLKNSQEAIELSQKHQGVYPVIGIHPNDCWDEKVVDDLAQLITDDVVAIGEVGLDYHYEKRPSKEVQIKCFRKQIELAHKYQIPIIVHSRDAHEDTYKIIKEYKELYPELRFILHSYSSGPSYVELYAQLGVYFSFSGVVTFKNARETQEAAKMVPLDLIFCETDTPYLAPVPYRGKINLPQYVASTIAFIAQLRNIDLDHFIDQLNINFEKCFPKIK